MKYVRFPNAATGHETGSIYEVKKVSDSETVPLTTLDATFP
jgi:hypothetical protein